MALNDHELDESSLPHELEELPRWEVEPLLWGVFDGLVLMAILVMAGVALWAMLQ